MKGEVVGTLGDLEGGGGGVLGDSGVRGQSSSFSRAGRGDKGGFPLALPPTVPERGGSVGRSGVGGGPEIVSARVIGAAGDCGDSTVITGLRGDRDTVLRPSFLGVGNNCGDLSGARPVARSRGVIRGFGFGLGGGCGDDVLIGLPSIDVSIFSKSVTINACTRLLFIFGSWPLARRRSNSRLTTLSVRSKLDFPCG